VIIWINDGFGAGKTTLAQELHRRLPDTVIYDPGDVGLMLRKQLPPDGAIQHLPSWRAASRTGRSCCARTGSPRPIWPTSCWPGPG
jgi:hypothetical protein